MADSSRENPEGIPGYDVVAASGAYSNITGLVSGFALTAVILAFTIAATADLTAAQRVDLGFATTLFALGFVGCLLCAFSLASLSGEESSVATLTNSMLIGSGLSVCLIAVLGGFEALATAFLPDAALVFLVVCTAMACTAPPFVWFPQWDIIQRYGPPEYFGPPKDQAQAGRLVFRISILGAFAALGGLAVQQSSILGAPEHWQYLTLTFIGLAYTSAMVLGGLWVSTWTHRARLSVRLTWFLAGIQSVTIFALIALLP